MSDVRLITTPDDWASEGLYLGDCRELLRDLEENSIDAVPTDPPYGLGFMGKTWDTFAPGREAARVNANRDAASDNPNVAGRQRSPASSPSAVEYDRTLAGQRLFQDWTASWASEVYRVLKPGGYLAVCGAPRSFHRMASGLEDAGFEVRDCLCWLFGQGFPKSLNLPGGIGTALKPAWEPIVLARKPLGKLTVAQCVKLYGTGGLNIDACRVGDPRELRDLEVGTPVGRWPANLALDEDAAALLDAEVGVLKSGARSSSSIRSVPSMGDIVYGATTDVGTQAYPVDVPASSGGPSRFFYCAKVSRAEREFGCDHLPRRSAGEATGGRAEGSAGLRSPRAGASRGTGAVNAHPTVKPIALMRWVIKLITPPGGIVLDPFVGSGTTAIAAALEHVGFWGSDLESEWLQVAHARVEAWRARGAVGDGD